MPKLQACSWDWLYFDLVPDGKPFIGLVPGFSNVFLAAGHEGEGLSLVFCSNLFLQMILIFILMSLLFLLSFRVLICFYVEL